MTERKPWSHQQDNLLLELTKDTRFGTGQKLRWGEIASELGRGGSKRSGKQCRQRWHNQLKPGIDNDRDWSSQQQKILFKEQEQHGNRWALIAKMLPGRTDNNIKNYFYSSLRKALRQANAYVAAHKREQRYRNVKEFKPQTLSKILAVAESKYEQKINLKSFRVINDAKQIKKLLVQIQLDSSIDPNDQKSQILEETVNQILEFNRNCKRRKSKKRDQDSLEEQHQSQEISSEIESMHEGKSIQSKKQPNSRTYGSKKEKQAQAENKRQEHQKQQQEKKEIQGQEQDIVNQVMTPMNQNNSLQLNKNKKMLDSGKIIEEKGLVQSQSSNNNTSSLLQTSLLFNRGITGAMMLNKYSYQFSRNDTQHYTKGLNLIDSMPIYEPVRSVEGNGGPQTKQYSANFQQIRMVDPSRMLNTTFQDAFQLITNLENLEMKKRITSNLSKNQDLDWPE